MTQKAIAKINPEILQWAREQCGLTFEQAVGSNFNPEKLRKAENGEIFLTFNQLLTIANKYGRNPAFFYLNKIPKDELIDDFRTPSSLKVKFTPKLRKFIMYVKEKRKLALEYKFYDKEYEYLYVNSINLEDNITDVAKIISNVLKINLKERKSWRDKYSALREWITAIEAIGILIFQISRIEQNEMRAFSISETPFPVIALNRGDSPLGRIFSLIHELCHIMLEKGGICTYRTKDEEHFKVEKFCNAVAGEVLVPTSSLLNQKIVKNHGTSKIWEERELGSLKRVYWVSSEVLLRRLLTLNLTSKKYYQEMKKEWEQRLSSAGGFGERGHLTVLRTNSPNFIKIVLNAMYDNEILMKDVSYYLGMSLKYFNDLVNNIEF